MFAYNLSSAGHAMFDSLLLTFHLSFLLPPDELVQNGSMHQFLPERILSFIPVIGVIMVVGRIVDAIADPLIASWSDRSRSRFGRRRFFMAISALPLALSTVMIFFPPVIGVSHINTVYLAVAFALFFLFYTMYVAPYIALIPELASDDKSRLGITTAQGFFALVGGAIAMIGGPVLIGLFSSSGYMYSYRAMIIILSVLGLALLASAVFAINEKNFSSAVPSTVKLRESLRMTLTNRYFLIYLGGTMALWFVFNVLRSSAIHIGQTLMKLPVESAGLNFIILFVVAGFSFVIVLELSKRIGKKRMLMIGLALFAVLSLCVAATGLLPIDRVLYGRIIFGLCGFPTAVLLVVPNVYVAELCDYDCTITGEHREGIYFGTQGFFLKLNLGLSTAITSYFFVTFGKEIQNPLGVRLALVFAALVSVCGIGIFRSYPEGKLETYHE